jgi:hypothetical protein
MPAVEIHHCAVVVAEVAEQPPEPLGSPRGPVGDDEDSGVDAGATSRTGEFVSARQRVPSARSGLRRQVGVDVEEARTRDVAGEVDRTPTTPAPELPAAIDELVAQRYQLPIGDGGSGTEGGRIT